MNLLEYFLAQFLYLVDEISTVSKWKFKLLNKFYKPKFDELMMA